MTTIPEKKGISTYKLLAIILGGLLLLFLFAFACYHFGVGLTDMT